MPVQRAAQVVGATHGRPAQDCRRTSGVAVAAHPSHIPSTIQRTGEFLCADQLPHRRRRRWSRSPRGRDPAPRLSIASSGSPSSLPSASQQLHEQAAASPCMLACFTVADSLTDDATDLH